VLLSYRLPREPSSPRIAVWRKLERLGVARLGDGLVALPADARTREQFEWIADEVGESGGTASVWLARPTSEAQERQIAEAMQEARAVEYQAVIDEARALTAADNPRLAARRLRSELRRIDRRDFFPPAQRDLAHAAVARLVADPDQPPSRARQRTPS
jgi:uncharacterized protein YdbL (DUF1318 family)